MTTRITSTWSDNKGEGKVTYSPDYKSLDRGTKLDFLNDVIFELNREFSAVLKDRGTQ